MNIPKKRFAANRIVPSALAGLIALWAASGFADCNPGILSNTSPERYTVNSDNSVTDRKTGLTWMRCPAGYEWLATEAQCAERAGAKTLFTWQEALVYADAVVDPQGTRWRLPNTKELESLLKRDCSDPAIETAVFSDLELANHWTSTSAFGYFGNAWTVNFRDGSHVTVDKQNTFAVRLVRID